jgi:hypothetical protein
MANQLSPADQARVRVAAMVAAGNATLGEAFLARIIDEASAFTSTDAQVRYAVTATQEYLGVDRPTNILATPAEQLALARLGRHLAPWERGMIAAALGISDTESGTDGPTSGRRYDEMPGDIGSITPHNFIGSHYHQCGLDYATFDALRREGFNGQNIMNAANDARSLGFRATNRDRVRDLAIIDRHSTDPRGNVRALQDYRRRTEGDAELQALILQRQRATSEAEQRALDAQIAARRLEHERASGLHPFINGPDNDPRASAATKRTKDAIDRYQEEHRLNPDLTEEQRVAARARVGPPEVRRADAAEIATARSTQSEAEMDGNFLAMMGGTTAPTPGPGQPPAVIRRADAPERPPTGGTPIVQAAPPGGPPTGPG